MIVKPAQDAKCPPWTIAKYELLAESGGGFNQIGIPKGIIVN